MDSRLAPSGLYPDDPAALTDLELQVLHTQLQRQLDYEDAHQFAASPETEFRHAEIRVEIEQREFAPFTRESRARLIVGR